MMLTLVLTAGLLAAPEPQAQFQKRSVVGTQSITRHPKQTEPSKGKGWTVEVRGYTYHRQDVLQRLLEGWTIEVGGHTDHLKPPQQRKEFIIEFQWRPQPEPAGGQYQPVESTYHDDLSAFWKQSKAMQVEAVKAFYVKDLPAYFKQLKGR